MTSLQSPMADDTTNERWNVGRLLDDMALQRPDAIALAHAQTLDSDGNRQYQEFTFAQLSADSTKLAAGLASMGVVPGTRLALMVPPSIDFVSLVFALFKVGAVGVFVDPGMGRKNMLRCLDQVQPEGFIGIPIVQAVRVFSVRRFKNAKFNVTVGRRWFWSGATIDELRSANNHDFLPIESQPDDSAAVIFTSGSTGPPKGVEFSHRNFSWQVRNIQERYGIEPGDIDVQAFPLFGLFNCAMGVTSVIPAMDFSRPATVDPANFLEAIFDWNATQAFASPAVWNRVGQYCEEQGAWIPSLRRILSAGAPVPSHLLRKMKMAAPNAEIFTPYGATEALPVASISASEVLEETQDTSDQGGGTCVGSRFAAIEWKIIPIDENAIDSIDQVSPVEQGQIGELIVRGPVITRRYITSEEATAKAKIRDGDQVWHRMGDLGYLDSQDRFWFCGRKAHRVQTPNETLFTIPVEGIFNTHPAIFRSALVGIGEPGEQIPVVIVQPWPASYPDTMEEIDELTSKLRELAVQFPTTEMIEHFLIHPSFPVDLRHNSKIFREKLAEWAADRLEDLVPA